MSPVQLVALVLVASLLAYLDHRGNRAVRMLGQAFDVLPLLLSLVPLLALFYYLAR